MIDRLAGEGVRFTRFFANGRVLAHARPCSRDATSNGSVASNARWIGNIGRYDDAIRLRATHDLGLPAGETSLGQLLKGAGYATALFGKWHLGYEDRFAPSLHGFDRALYCVGGGMDYFHHVEPTPVPGNDRLQAHVLRLDGRPEKRDGYFTDIIAGEAEQFIATNRDRPFFLYVPFNAPHSPFQGPGDRLPHPLAKDSPLWNQSKGPPAVYAAMIERMDAAVGRILAVLENEGLAGRTLVIFTSDNGGTRSARSSGLRDIKGTTFEGGIRVPCVVRWPGVLPKQTTSTQVAITMDLTASIVRAAGAKLTAGRPFDGVDILGRLAERRPESPRTLFWRGRRGDSTWKAVRDGSLKYVIRTVGGAIRTEGLYDLDADVGEQHDLLPTRSREAARLRQLLAAWEKEVRRRDEPMKSLLNSQKLPVFRLRSFLSTKSSPRRFPDVNAKDSCGVGKTIEFFRLLTMASTPSLLPSGAASASSATPIPKSYAKGIGMTPDPGRRVQGSNMAVIAASLGASISRWCKRRRRAR